MGIDPGLGSTGVGVIESRDDVWRLVGCREARTNASSPLPARLKTIHDLVEDAIGDFKPDAVAIESLFFAKNVRSAVMMAHGRGVAILAAAASRVPVLEYSPLEIKQSVVGKGRASKLQVMQMVKVLLALPKMPESDHMADALACALAHAYRSRMNDRIIADSEPGEPESSLALETLNPAKALLAQARRPRRRR